MPITIDNDTIARDQADGNRAEKIRTDSMPMELPGGFDQEWNRANQLYAQYLQAGYDPEDADVLTRAPVKAKWEAIAAVPQTVSKESVKRLANEFDDAADRVRQLSEAGYDTKEAADMALTPALEKSKILLSGWRQSAKTNPLPHTASQVRDWYAQSPSMQAEDRAAREELKSQPPLTVMENHPALAKYPPFSSVFRPIQRSAMMKSGKVNDPKVAQLMAEKDRLLKRQEKFDSSVSQSDRFATEDRLASIDRFLQDYVNEQEPVSASDSVQLPGVELAPLPEAKSEKTFKVGRFTVSQ